MENGLDERVHGAAPKLIMQQFITVEVQTKQVMSLNTNICGANEDVEPPAVFHLQ